MPSNLDIASLKKQIAQIAFGVFNDKKDFADIVMLERDVLNAVEIEYTFCLKALADDEKSEKLMRAFMDNYHKTQGLKPVGSKVVVENNTLKELFYLKIIHNAYKD